MLIFCFISNAIGCLFMSIYVYEIHYGKSKQIKKKEGNKLMSVPNKINLFFIFCFVNQFGGVSAYFLTRVDQLTYCIHRKHCK